MNEKQITINQHFVPQCYLKEFTNNDGRVFAYNKFGQLLKNKYPPKSILFDTLLYELNIKDPDNKIENFFAKIEDKYAILSKKLLGLKEPESFNLKQEDQLILFLFILRISLGNPSQYDNLNNEDFNKSWERELNANNLSEENRKESINNLQEHNRQQVPIAIEVAFQPKFLLEFMLRKKFIFIFAENNNFFLTSDNPVIEWCEKGTGLLDGTTRLTDTNYDVALSPYIYLRIIDNEIDKYSKIENLSLCYDKNGEISKIHNKKMFNQCREFVYGNIQDHQI